MIILLNLNKKNDHILYLYEIFVKNDFLYFLQKNIFLALWGALKIRALYLR